VHYVGHQVLALIVIGPRFSVSSDHGNHSRVCSWFAELAEHSVNRVESSVDLLTNLTNKSDKVTWQGS
jgi:hypothetical protein